MGVIIVRFWRTGARVAGGQSVTTKTRVKNVSQPQFAPKLITYRFCLIFGRMSAWMESDELSRSSRLLRIRAANVSGAWPKRFTPEKWKATL